jgi:hypothetical protein
MERMGARRQSKSVSASERREEVEALESEAADDDDAARCRRARPKAAA